MLPFRDFQLGHCHMIRYAIQGATEHVRFRVPTRQSLQSRILVPTTRENSVIITLRNARCRQVQKTFCVMICEEVFMLQTHDFVHLKRGFFCLTPLCPHLYLPPTSTTTNQPTKQSLIERHSVQKCCHLNLYTYIWTDFADSIGFFHVW